MSGASLARDNPFRMRRLEALDYRLAGGLDALLDRFAALDHRAAIVGPHGSGKTSLLAALESRLAARGLRWAGLRLQRGERWLGLAGEQWLRRAAPGVVLVLDGSDELHAAERWRVLRRSRAASGLLLASHRRTALPTLHHCRPDAPLLAELIAELHAGCGCSLPPAEQLFVRHAGNLREALRELYDLHAGGASTRPPPG